MEKLANLMKYESEQMEREFAKASACGKGTPQEVADFREGYFHGFIRRYFPFPYQVAKGNIGGFFMNHSSDSIDCIICNPIHPHTVDLSGRYSLILAEGVDSAIEVKPDISKKDELIRGLHQIQSVKKIVRFDPLGHQLKLLEAYNTLIRHIHTFIFSITTVRGKS